MLENNSKKEKEFIPAQRFADLILDMGTYLLSSGAHCGRIDRNLARIGNIWDFDINIDPTFKGLTVKVRDRNNHENTVTSYCTSPPHNVHLAILTEISHLSWETNDYKLSISEVEEKFKIIKQKKSYPAWLIAIAIGFSCAGLCMFSGGDIYNAINALVAASIGFYLKVFMDKRDFNSMISIGAAAFVTTLITGLGNIYEFGASPQAALATAILYLIPGVPLINCVIDLIEGYLSSAINRALFGGFILLCIATGMTLCITLLGIQYFN